MRSIFTLLFIIGIAGCATTPPPIAPDLVTRIKRVSVISLTADEFTRQYVGVTVFGNEREQVSISSWEADKAYEEQLGSAAERIFSATLIKADYTASDFVPVNDINGPWDAPAFWGPNWGKIEAPTKKYCQQNSLDALIVVARRKSGDIFGRTNQFISGAGIYTKRGINLLHLLSVVSVLDCRTGKELATRFLVVNTPQSDGKPRYSPPTLSLSESLARTPLPQWTPEAEARVRDQLLKLPKNAWEDTLRAMVSTP